MFRRLFFRASIWTLLLVVLPVWAEDAKVTPRTLSFQIAVPCNCASCVFDVQRVIRKFEGVQSVKFNGRERRFEIAFTEAGKAISELTQAVEKSELGQGSTLCWPVPKGADAKKLAENLATVAGVKSARHDAKSGLLLLNFQEKPVVTLKQLDVATQGETHVGK